jgi:RHS repeat-associated protein
VYYSDAFGTPTFKDANGTPLAGTTTATRFLFTGREWLAALNLYEYRNRTYSAELGRFIETDPIRFKANDVNLYRYVANTPVSSVDPMGLEAEMICNRCPENGRQKCKTIENGKTSDVFPTNCGPNRDQIDPGAYTLQPKPRGQMEHGNRGVGPQNFNGGKVQRGNSGEDPEYPEGTPSVTGKGLEAGQPYHGAADIRVHGPGPSDGCITTDRAGGIQDMMDRNPGMKITITDTKCICEDGQLVPIDP